jgi:hypothetical protein
LEIEAGAKRRLADEYDAAQVRGEVAKHGGGRNFKVPNKNVETTAADVGLSRKEIHEARQIRDAEKRASFTERSIGPAVNFTKAPDARRRRRPDRGLRCLLGQSTAAGQNSAA